MRHPAVAFAGAIGQPDAHSGETAGVYVELVAGAEAGLDDLLAHARAQHPRTGGGAEAPGNPAASCPKTAVGKVFKPDLRRRAITRIFDAALAAAGSGARVARVEEDRRRGLVAVLRPGPAGPDEAAVAETLGACRRAVAVGRTRQRNEEAPMIRGFAIDGGRLSRSRTPSPTPPAWSGSTSSRPTTQRRRASRASSASTSRPSTRWPRSRNSARLYLDRGAAFLTATLPVRTDSGQPVGAPVTFILAGRHLVTVRYDTPRPFETFPQRAERLDLGCSDGESVLLALLDAIVERLADILEIAGQRIESLSREVFRRGAPGSKSRDAPDFRAILQGVGGQADVVSHVLASLVTFERLVAFLSAARGGFAAGKDARARLKSLARDTRFLADHANFLSQKVTFLLDATLGMISIEQNAIIKIFSVAAVIFLPPTLVASIYGMNFTVMPELNWAFGYPFAILLMVASAVVSYLVFKTPRLALIADGRSGRRTTRRRVRPSRAGPPRAGRAPRRGRPRRRGASARRRVPPQDRSSRSPPRRGGAR